MKNRITGIFISLLICIFITSCGFNAEKEYNSINTDYANGTTFSKYRNDINEYIESYNEAFSKANANKRSEMASYDMHAHVDEVVSNVIALTSQNSNEAWNAAAWLNQVFGWSPTATITIKGSSITTSVQLSATEINSRSVVTSRLADAAESYSGYAVTTIYDNSGKRAISIDSPESPWTLNYSADATVSVMLDYNGLRGMKNTEAVIPLTTPYAFPVIDMEGVVFSGWSLDKEVDENSVVIVPGQTVNPFTMPIRGTYYAQYDIPFNGVREIARLEALYENGEPYSVIKEAIEDYMVYFDESVEEARAEYQEVSSSASAEITSLQRRLNSVGTEEERSAISAAINELKESSGTTLNALSERINDLVDNYDYRTFGESIIPKIVNVTYEDNDDAWDATSWLYDLYSWLPSATLYVNGTSASVSLPIDETILDSHQGIIDPLVTLLEERGYTITALYDQSGEPITRNTVIDIENPWHLQFSCDAMVELTLDYNGLDRKEDETITLNAEDVYVLPSPDVHGALFLGWSFDEYVDENSSFYQGGALIAPGSLDNRKLYAHYLSMDVALAVQDLDGNRNGKANIGEAVNIYPVVTNRSTIDLEGILSIGTPTLPETIVFNVIGQPEINLHLEMNRTLIAAGNLSFVLEEGDALDTASYFAVNTPSDRYSVAISNEAEVGILTIPVTVRTALGNITVDASLAVSDPNFRVKADGFSFVEIDGNGDGKVSPGETIGLDILFSAYEDSDSAYEIRGLLSTTDGNVTLIRDNASYESVEVGEYVTTFDRYSTYEEGMEGLRPSGNSAYQMRFSPNMQAGDVPFLLTLTDRIGARAIADITIPVTYVDADIELTKWDFIEVRGDNDGSVNPGETIHIGYLFSNTGSATLRNVRIVFSTQTPGVRLRDNVISLDELRYGRSLDSRGSVGTMTNTNVNASNGLEVIISEDYEVGTPIVINWTVSGSGANPDGWSGNISIPVTMTRKAITIASYAFFDPDANNDGIISPGETFTLDAALRNSGTAEFEGLSYTYTSNSEYITISNAGPYNFTNRFEAGSYLRLSSNTKSNNMPQLENKATVAFTVSPNAPVGTEAEIKLVITDGYNTWERSVTVKIEAPDSELKVYRRSIIDNGNGDGIVNVGETGYLDFVVFNDGTSTMPVTATLTSNTSGIVVTNSTYDFGNVPGGAYMSIRSGNTYSTSASAVSVSSTLANKARGALSFRVTDRAEVGTTAQLTLTLSNGYESRDFPLTFTISEPKLGVSADITIVGKNSGDPIYPGEALNFEIVIQNTSSSATISGLTVRISTDSSYISIPTPLWRISGSLYSGNRTTLRIRDGAPRVVVDAEPGEDVPITITISDSTGQSRDFRIVYTIGDSSY